MSLALLFQLFTQVLAELPEAIAAYNEIKAMIEGGQDPTADQIAAAQAAVDKGHAAVQGA